MLMITVFGALFSLLAIRRESLRAGMIAHAWHDSIQRHRAVVVEARERSARHRINTFLIEEATQSFARVRDSCDSSSAK
jgi:hypothetical protein